MASTRPAADPGGAALVPPSRRRDPVTRVVALVAMAFGLATIAAGTRVLLGADPGYVVWLPLLAFNTGMGVLYGLVGVLTWLRSRLALPGAGAIAVANALALAALLARRGDGAAVAAESLQAMMFRTGVWILLAGALAWVAWRRRRAPTY